MHSQSGANICIFCIEKHERRFQMIPFVAWRISKFLRETQEYIKVL